MELSFRVDASLTMGAGHVMRCMALAEALRARGHDCRFICRDLEGNLSEKLREAGFELTLLPKPTKPSSPQEGDPPHADWAQVPWEVDAAQTFAAVQTSDWLVIDHYAFEARWEKAAKPARTKLMVIDDLADREHVADLLLDQNLGRKACDYDGLMPDGNERIIGPKYALLRPEFALNRAKSLKRRVKRNNILQYILVTIGGVDLRNTTGAILDVLKEYANLNVTVVMGPRAVAVDKVLAQTANLRIPVKVVVDTPEISKIMAHADLAISAAGGTSWEKCAMGLPSIITIVAKNQIESAAALVETGAAISIGKPQSPEFATRLRDALRKAQSPDILGSMSHSAAAIVDGKGTDRVASALEDALCLREASIDHAETIWEWRQAMSVTHLRRPVVISLEDHLEWFAKALNDDSRLLYVVGTPFIGHLRLDLDGLGSATVSIILAPQACGKGIGSRMLSLLADKARAANIHSLFAEVHENNTTSIALFKSAGYIKMNLSHGYYCFKLIL